MDLVNDPQIWTLLGVFSAIMFAALTLSTRYTVAQIIATEARLGGRIDALEARTDARFDAVDARFGAVDSRFDQLEKRLDAKIDHVAEVLGVRIDSVDHRLGSVEDDLRIVKAHLLRHPAA
ncbi:hypothetical protein RB608_15580 [Nocardioides sp. LHD-245]|uniref:hypothetical protein n=1 Tax=Nocardioides sp. LHD-245 TaxID=3051387 RepID=UPI0027E1191C|nr:hypothetical protein [Nocardioides sp. LHD-245]